MATENSNKSKLLLKLKKLKMLKISGILHTLSHTNVCKFFNFQLTFSQLILRLKC